MMKRILIAALIVLLSVRTAAQDSADKYLGYKWQTTRLSSYTTRHNAPEVEENLTALSSLYEAEKAERKGKYIDDIINGLWFYAVAHAWSTPEETGGRLPAREGQTPTPTSLRTAALLHEVWNEFGTGIDARVPQVGETLRTTTKRITGKEL